MKTKPKPKYKYVVVHGFEHHVYEGIAHKSDFEPFPPAFLVEVESDLGPEVMLAQDIDSLAEVDRYLKAERSGAVVKYIRQIVYEARMLRN